MRYTAALILALLLTACGEARRFGDAGGLPTTFTVQVERPFFSSMENRQGRPSAGAGFAVGSGGWSSVGVGIGFEFSSTQVYLLGGDQVGQGNVFRQEVKWGQNTFTVPLTPGRTLHLTVQAQGGRRGWEAIGSLSVPATDPAVSVVLNASGASLTVTPATPPTDQTPAPGATPPTAP